MALLSRITCKAIFILLLNIFITAEEEGEHHGLFLHTVLELIKNSLKSGTWNGQAARWAAAAAFLLNACDAWGSISQQMVSPHLQITCRILYL